jgi:hypothetical protein
LYRNLKDWVTVDELDIEIHFPKEGVVLSRGSRPSEKFMHGIKVCGRRDRQADRSRRLRRYGRVFEGASGDPRVAGREDRP